MLVEPFPLGSLPPAYRVRRLDDSRACGALDAGHRATLERYRLAHHDRAASI